MTENQNSFIKTIGAMATLDMQCSGILASLTIAQAILESNWGNSSLAQIGNALFGIKATNWIGKVYNKDTQECYNGVDMLTVNANFRAYDSWKDSIADHSALLTQNDRYRKIIGETDYKRACQYIKEAGYATDPDYTSKLIKIIETNKLYEYDKEANSMAKVFIGVGHGGSDSGATGNGLKESDINLGIALACKKELERHGVIVGISRTVDEDDPVTQEVKECNAFGPDLAVDFHTNAGGGDGFEAIYSIVEGMSKVLAKNIEAEVLEIGQNSRGIYTKINDSGTDYFCFVRETNCPAIIAECAFIDNADDVQMVNTQEGQKQFAVAYAKGILKTLGITYQENKGEEAMVTRYNTIDEVPAWAKKTIQKLVDKGYIADVNNLDLSHDMIRVFVVEDRAGVYE